MESLLVWLYGISPIIQIISLVTGIVFMVMQSLQYKWMWYLGLLTSGTALVVSLVNMNEGAVWAPLWAQVAMNGYFFAMDVVGIFSWKKFEEAGSGSAVHIVRLPRGHIPYYVLAIVLATPLVCFLLSLTNDPEPVADGVSFALSIVAQIMLTRSYIEQWYLWMAADVIAIMVFASQGAWWMVALYGCYIVNAVFGVNYWKKHGQYVS